MVEKQSSLEPPEVQIQPKGPGDTIIAKKGDTDPDIPVFNPNKLDSNSKLNTIPAMSSGTAITSVAYDGDDPFEGIGNENQPTSEAHDEELHPWKPQSMGHIFKGILEVSKEIAKSIVTRLGGKAILDSQLSERDSGIAIDDIVGDLATATAKFHARDIANEAAQSGNVTISPDTLARTMNDILTEMIGAHGSNYREILNRYSTIKSTSSSD
jgi:hypothetical protein